MITDTISVLCGVRGVPYSNLTRFEGETRCARDFTVKMFLKTPQSLPHISLPPQIPGDSSKGHHRHHTKQIFQQLFQLKINKFYKKQLNVPNSSLSVVSIISDQKNLVSLTQTLMKSHFISCDFILSQSEPSKNQNIKRNCEISSFFFFPFKEQSCFTALLKSRGWRLP